MRILHVASGDSWAGAEVQVFQLLRALARDPGIDLTAVLLNEGELASRLRYSGVRTYAIDESRLGTWSIARRLIKLTRELQPHIVHTHRAKENIIGACAAFLTPGAISVRTVHGASENPPAGLQLARRAARFLDEFTGRYVQARVIAVSDELRGRLANTYGAARVASICNGIDVDDVRNQAAADAPQLNGTLKIGFVGRLTAVKRVDIFVDTALEIVRRGVQARFFVIGDGPLRRQLEERASRWGLAAVCEFPGFQANCLPLMKQLDVLVLTSDHEGLPMTVLEALALGVPVVAHEVGGLPEVLDGWERGALVRDHHASGYADAIQEVLRRRDERDTGVNLLPLRFHISECASQYAQLYRSLLREG
jgi:glycosyltransferase involved in cell wall biosynthesis